MTDNWPNWQHFMRNELSLGLNLNGIVYKWEDKYANTRWGHALLYVRSSGYQIHSKDVPVLISLL